MLTKTKVALAAALVIGTASFGAASAASDNSGEYSGGFVVRGNSSVNPAYHPRWFTNTRGAGDFAAVAPHARRAAPAAHEDNYGSEAGKE